jgi:hypothetical protein
MPFNVNVPVAKPAPMVMVSGDTVARPVLLLLRVTVRALVGAGETVTVPVIERPTPTRLPGTEMVIVLRLVLVNEKFTEVSPVADAVTV